MKLSTWIMLPTLWSCTADKITDSADAATPAPTCEEVGSPYERDDQLRLNHVQALGTHNSTHQEPETLWDPSHAYSHPTLTEQLSMGVRMMELDVHLREDVGLQVFHLPVIDEETSCLLFEDCLGELKAWSDEHPCHMPLLIWIEAKDDADVFDETLLPLLNRYSDIEAEISAVWPEGRVITPDEVRSGHDTLPDALAEDGWPTLGELRGRIMFALIGDGEHRTAYLEESPGLEGRLLFVDMDDLDHPAAALAKGGNAETQREQVEAGLLVTTNIDGVDRSDEDNAASRDAALGAGVHFVATDILVPAEAGGYFAEIPGGQPARCNPIAVSEGCVAEDIEDID